MALISDRVGPAWQGGKAARFRRGGVDLCLVRRWAALADRPCQLYHGTNLTLSEDSLGLCSGAQQCEHARRPYSTERIVVAPVGMGLRKPIGTRRTMHALPNFSNFERSPFSGLAHSRRAADPSTRAARRGVFPECDAQKSATRTRWNRRPAWHGRARNDWPWRPEHPSRAERRREFAECHAAW